MTRNIVARLLAVVLLTLSLPCAGTISAGDQPSRPRPDPDFFPLGVYLPWETTFVGKKEERDARLEGFLTARLDDLARHGVNLVWTVNGPDAKGELALLCRLADARGIRIVAGGSHYSMQRSEPTDAWAERALPQLKAAWTEVKAGPRPFAFALADEPQTAYAGPFGRFVKKATDAGLPTTTVVMHQDIESIVKQAPDLTYVCTDNYPFFGSPHGPRGDFSYGFYRTTIDRFVRLCQAADKSPWVMGQAFQEIWGPARIEPDGEVTALPGSGLHWVMPTPAQIRWQVWTASALGSKGIVCYSYGLTGQPKLDADARTKGWSIKTAIATGGPTSLVSWPDYRPGPQYRALATAYAELRPMTPLLLRLQSVADEGQRVGLESPRAGDVLNILRKPGTEEYYAGVVARPTPGGSLTLVVSPNVERLEPLGGAPYVRLVPGTTPFQRAVVDLEPGQGAFYRIHPSNRYRRTALFHEDFRSDEFAANAHRVANLKPEGKAGAPRPLRATKAEPEVVGEKFPACDCYIVYDLKKLVPKTNPNAKYAIRFDAGGVSPEVGQGVFLWSGPSLDLLAPLASTVAAQSVVVLGAEDRYLKIGVSYRQATPEYAALRSWSLVEWLAVGVSK